MTLHSSDQRPDHSNPLAVLIGRIFHPYIVCIPTILIVLNDLTLAEALLWSTLVLGIVLTPGILISYYVAIRYKRYLYQRKTRGPLYFIGFLSVLACLGVLLLLDAPQILIASLITLILWVPAQMLINAYVTKISAHAGVLAGCSMALLLTGKVTSLVALLLLIVVIVVTLWARVETKNHTTTQVIMGFLLGSLPVLIVFPLLLT